MDGRGRTFLLLQVFFCFFVFASSEEAKQNCSQVQCPGPLSYYDDMGCTPVYRNQGDCCAFKYNCDHLDARSPNKCYIKNSSYEIGQFANREDVNRCDMTCVCAVGGNSTGFWCTFRMYIPSSFSSHKCYLKRNIHECGPGTVTCVKNVWELPQCVVGEHTYMAGEFFVPQNEPRKLCICQEGYTGDNIEPFCITPNLICAPQFYDSKDIANKNAPIYNVDENTAISCTNNWRRQNENDTVIPNPNGSTASEENSSGGEGLTCKFGNLTMNIGDMLSRSTELYLECARCVCEVPPTPTCRYLSSDECSYDRYYMNF